MNRILLLALALFGVSASAQIDVTPRGTDATLDVASWNVEFFGTTSPTDRADTSPNDAVQYERVRAVLLESQIDVWGLQEVSDGDDFETLRASLVADGYDGVLGPNVSSPNQPFDQKLAFIYDTSVLSNVTSATLFEGQSAPFRGGTRSVDFLFAGRLPLELRATVSVGGLTRDVRFITIHAKASGDPESYDRRAAAADVLRGYTDGLEAQGESVVILGDFNDLLTGSTRGTTFSSPYQGFVTDPDYTAATLTTEQAGLATFCGSRDSCSGDSTIDHILFTTASLTFVPADGNPQFQRYGELLDGITQYTATTSDHLPVLANLTLEAPVAGEGTPQPALALLAAAPNPFRGRTQLRFRLDAPGDVSLEVFDTLGRRVASLAGAFGPGEHPVPLDGAALAPGTYLVRLAAAGQVRTQRIVRVR